MRITFNGTRLTVTKTDTDHFRKDSTFYYYVVRELRKQGHDVIRQVPSKDGHLCSAPYYIRERKGTWALIDHYWALRSIVYDFNRYGKTHLSIVMSGKQGTQ